MKFESLTKSHISSLLQFELDNRLFFESLIAPREEGFYSIKGVERHIEQLGNDSCAAFVAIKQKQIVARANLKNVLEEQSAEVGFRVSKDYIGQGVGSECLKFLIEQAKELKLNMLFAYVIDNNKASERVLIKNGFSLNLNLPDEFEHRGHKLNGFQYIRNLA